VTALYRKYRPQDFDEVVGQEAVVRTLSNAITHGQVRQAYLFAGPRGTGKTSLARILAKSLNCTQGPTVTPDKTCHVCQAIAAGNSLDVVEMDAASQRGIDDIREMREHVVLQPVEGRYKVYILDEAHQLTDAAWNALLKLIEEPPPHLVFIFCTTELSKVIPTVRSRCQVFAFARPRLPELVQVLEHVCKAEEIEAPAAALALIARAARGSFRDAVSLLDQLSSATEHKLSVQAVLQLLGVIEEDALFRLIDLVVAGDTAGALVAIEELSSQGQDLGRLIGDLLDHLRYLMLVQQMNEVPDSLPVTEETRGRLLEQAHQLPQATVLRLCDLLGEAIRDMRAGGDPRLPLELALVKATRPAADLSWDALSHRLELLEQRPAGSAAPVPASAASKPAPKAKLKAAPEPERGGAPDSREQASEPEPPPEADAPAAADSDSNPEPESISVELQRLQEAWQRSIVPAIASIPTRSIFQEARPVALEGSRLSIEFPNSASFHRKMAADEKNAAQLSAAIFELTGARLSFDFTVAEKAPTSEEKQDASAEPTPEEDLISLLKDTLDAHEVED
jgi:DNA polymerase-3 subunit gamma/tau